ncbi:MAG TPA: dihydrodipicolinate synthase family protein [Caldimonas sp.]|nr:dihydrodipicolinate synthase family protein [Caldimonas sp.]
MTSSRPRGVIAATATPIDAEQRPDLARLLRHCRMLLDDGCDAINLLGTTGEATAFGIEQRLDVMRAVADGGLPLDRFMVGTGLPALDDTVRLTRAACELGFAGQLILPPFFYPQVPDDGLVAYVEALARRVDHPRLAIYLYHIPQNTQVPWPVEVVVRLRERLGATLVGLKDSAGDLAYARTVAAALPDFDVFPSSEAALGNADVDGFAGCISATANLTAPFAQAAWTQQGTSAGAAAVRKAGELRAIVAGHPLIAAVKAALAARYSDPAWARVALPLLPLAAEPAGRLGAALERRLAEP